MNNQVFKLFRSFSLSALLVAFVTVSSACSNGGDNQPASTVTSVPSPTITVTKTAITESLATAESVPTPIPSLVDPLSTAIAETSVPTATNIPIATEEPEESSIESIAEEKLIVSGCSIDSGSGVYGTAPAPTAIPLSSDSYGNLTELEQREFASAIAPISQHLERWSGEFERDWDYAHTSGQEAALLLVLNQRLSSLCDSFRALDETVSRTRSAVGVGEAIRVRHAWSHQAIQQLHCCGSAKSAVINVGRLDTHNYALQINSEIASLLSAGSMSEYVVDLTAVGLSGVLESGWLLLESAGSVVLIAPATQQSTGVAGLGPAPRYDGDSVRIRRLRVGEALSLSSTVQKFSHLPDQIGDVVSQSETTLFGLTMARWDTLDSNNWQKQLYVGPSGEHVFIIEVGCHMDSESTCAAAVSMLEEFVTS